MTIDVQTPDDNREPTAAGLSTPSPDAATAPRYLFSDVLAKELQDVARRRSPNAPPPDSPKIDASEEEKVRQLRRQALDEDLVGLALSGGGIRSATFCLGFLQALAEFRLLSRFDYLSTVSGGGYIGGWLAAWIKREGEVRNVERQLCPNRIDEARAKRWRGPQRPLPDDSEELRGPVLDAEPEPIHHLRDFSNYLAPRPGVFSADGWVLIAVYLRNLLLNQFVLLLALVALLFGTVTVVKFSAEMMTAHSSITPAFWDWVNLGSMVVGFLVAPLLIACLSMNASLRQTESTSQDENDPEDTRTATQAPAYSDSGSPVAGGLCLVPACRLSLAQAHRV